MFQFPGGVKGLTLQQAIVMHLDGIVGPSNMHSYALSSGNFLVGLRSISSLEEAWLDG